MLVVEELRNNNAFVAVKKIKHEYPTLLAKPPQTGSASAKEYFREPTN